MRVRSERVGPSSLFRRPSLRTFKPRSARLLPLLTVLGCATAQPSAPSAPAEPSGQAAPAPSESAPMASSPGPAAPSPTKKPDTAALKAELVAKHGEAQRARIERG